MLNLHAEISLEEGIRIMKKKFLFILAMAISLPGQARAMAAGGVPEIPQITAGAKSIETVSVKGKKTEAKSFRAGMAKAGSAGTAATQEESPGAAFAESTEAETEEVSESTGRNEEYPEEESREIPSIEIPDIIEGQKHDAMMVKGDTAYEMYYFNLKASNLYAETVNHTAEALGKKTDTKVYAVIVPLLESMVFTDEMRQSIDPDWKNEKAALDYYEYLFSEDVYDVPVYDALLEHRDEYIFFRTDHHWTGRGAYYAYAAWARQKGIEPEKLDSYEKVEFPGFLGSLYSVCKEPEMKNNPDTVEAFRPKTAERMTFVDRDGNSYSWPVINDVSDYKAGVKYGTFCGGDNPYSFIENPMVDNGETCVIVKDSYGNAFIPFLVDHYQYIYWFDYRYYSDSILRFAKEHNATDLIFVNGISPSSDTKMMERLWALMQ